jgi:hypothetical protein
MLQIAYLGYSASPHSSVLPTEGRSSEPLCHISHEGPYVGTVLRESVKIQKTPLKGKS